MAMEVKKMLDERHAHLRDTSNLADSRYFSDTSISTWCGFDTGGVAQTGISSKWLASCSCCECFRSSTKVVGMWNLFKEATGNWIYNKCNFLIDSAFRNSANVSLGPVLLVWGPCLWFQCEVQQCSEPGQWKMQVDHSADSGHGGQGEPGVFYACMTQSGSKNHRSESDWLQHDLSHFDS